MNKSLLLSYTLLDSVARRVDQMKMKDSQITGGRGRRPRKTIKETIRKDLEINELD